MDPDRGADAAPDARARAPFTEAFHPLTEGLALHYRDYAPAAPAGRLPVVCLHALSRNLKDFEDVAPAIAAPKDGRGGRRVIVPSMRGRGRSTWDPKPERYHPGVYAADVIGLLDALAIPRAVFVGTSLGGIVSMVVAASDAPRVAACVLNDVGAELAAAGIERIKSYVGRGRPARDWDEAAAMIREVQQLVFPTERDDAFWLAFARRTRIESEQGIVSDYDPVIGEVMRASAPAPASGAAQSLWPLFDALAAVPTLLVRGALSDLLVPATAAAMRARKSDLKVAEVPYVGHAPLLTEPAAQTALTAFLSGVE